MNVQVNPRQTVGCLIIIIIAIPIVSYLTTASLNPLSVYASGSLLAKIIISLLALVVVTSLIQLFAVYILRVVVKSGSGRSPEDVICPGCGLPLMQFMGSHGLPIMCPKCRRVWHNGPSCYNKGMPNPKITIPTYFCPLCRETESTERGMFDDDSPQFK